MLLFAHAAGDGLRAGKMAINIRGVVEDSQVCMHGRLVVVSITFSILLCI